MDSSWAMLQQPHTSAYHAGKHLFMSRHIPRHQRWEQINAREHRSGAVAVRYERGAWWAHIPYQQLSNRAEEGQLPEWETHSDRLGPFKRPRNAMIAAEDHVVGLRRRHGEDVSIDMPGLKE